MLRGGALSKTKQDDYRLLALAIQERVSDEEEVDLDRLEKVLSSLSSAQQALKGLDGAAHEAYQRTHHEGSVDTSVSGRARRSAARAGCTADALFAAELCELLEQPELLSSAAGNENSTLVGRQIVMNATSVVMTKDANVTVLVLYEPSYKGGAGLDHGGIEDLAGLSAGSSRGRLLVIVGDSVTWDLPKTYAILDEIPMEVELHTGLVAKEIASVQRTVYRTAGQLLHILEPTLRSYNETAVHFVGRSLAGGVASLSATILDGSLPMPPDRSEKRKKRKHHNILQETDDAVKSVPQLEGLGRGRSSAVVLGSPPCLSANVQAAFVKSIIYGDDVVCRSSKESFDRLCSRVRRGLKGGVLGRRVGWMADAVSLTVGMRCRWRLFILEPFSIIVFRLSSRCRA